MMPPSRGTLKASLLLGLAAFAALPAEALGRATASGGILRINAGIGAPDLTMETGPVTGEVRLSGVPGVADGTVFRGITAIDYVSGAGREKIKIDQKGTVLPSLKITTGAGSAEIEIKAEVDRVAQATSGIVLASGTGDTVLNLLLDSEADALDVRWNLGASTGLNLINASVISDEPTARLTGSIAATTGASRDKVELGIKSAATNVGLDLRVRTTNAEDEVKTVIEQLVPTTVRARVDYDLDGVSLTADKLDFLFAGGRSTLELTGDFKTGGNADLAKLALTGSVRGTFRADGGGGDDVVLVEVSGSYVGAASVLGGTGNDLLTFAVSGGASGTPSMNGGVGTDRCTGNVARVACERL